MGLEAPRSAGGVQRRVIGGLGEVNQGGTWIVKESYDVTVGGVRRLLDFAEPPGAVEGVVPDRGSDRQRGGKEAGSVDVGSDEPVRTREVAFAFGAGDLARRCINTLLLVLSSIGLVVFRTIRPIGKNEVSEGLEVQFPFPCGAEDAIPVRLI